MDVKQTQMAGLSARVADTMANPSAGLMTDPQRILALGQRLVSNSSATDIPTAVAALGLDPLTVAGLSKVEVGQAIVAAAQLALASRPRGTPGTR